MSFLVTPTKTGLITIKVTATSSVAGDAIEKTLLVVPEGVPQHKTEAFFIDLRDKSEFSDKFTIEVPKNAVPDSTRITVSGVGKLFIPSFNIRFFQYRGIVFLLQQRDKIAKTL